MAPALTAQQKMFHVTGTPTWPGVERILMALSQLKHDRVYGLLTRRHTFRQETATSPHGRCAGEPLAPTIAPGITQFILRLVRFCPLRKGKTLEVTQARRYNIFSGRAYLPSYLQFPFYRNYPGDSPGTFGSFAPCTNIAAGKTDPERQVSTTLTRRRQPWWCEAYWMKRSRWEIGVIRARLVPVGSGRDDKWSPFSCCANSDRLVFKPPPGFMLATGNVLVSSR